MTDDSADPIIRLTAAAGAGPDLHITPMSDRDAIDLGKKLAAMSPWSRYPYSASALTGYLIADEAGAPRFAVHLADGSLAGVIGLRLNWLRGPFVQLLAILPEHQGGGFGRRILAWVEGEARASKARNIWVTVSDFNADALRFYERLGFVRTAELDGLVQDGRDELLLRKRL